jgi:hypothetical protein
LECVFSELMPPFTDAGFPQDVFNRYSNNHGKTLRYGHGCELLLRHCLLGINILQLHIVVFCQDLMGVARHGVNPETDGRRWSFPPTTK